MRAFFFGLGYSSLAVVQAIRVGSHTVNISGTVRTPDKADRLTDQGLSAHVFDGTAPGATLVPDLRAATHVILSIAPGEAGDPALIQHRADLDAAENLEWLCYYSTVGVYGDFGGAWIDETAPLVPRNDRSDRRVAAEQAWRDYAAERGVPLCILRLAGIYGPGRSTFDKLADGTARRVIKPGQVFNRIHVEDIGRITALAADARLEGTLNLADDEPAPPQDLVTYAAGLMGVEPPPEVPFEQAEFTPMQKSFYKDNKRVSNAAIKRALGIELLYPNYRQSLDAIWETMP
ncbi:Nucleoside-diphosphate-sugar epimerase [Devosia sp. YR412]|uniref:SDR family oxidoreductase n=1 Tax=Devosia sp. YR412 TaxID=1881030 RepID=UPI0008B23561|nr:SDR family oxidoreductase [Devosia sp. YR412]SEP61880.1 Nucleoside-diphosphate-sugar epimerase [Devosia sp. YR412]